MTNYFSMKYSKNAKKEYIFNDQPSIFSSVLDSSLLNSTGEVSLNIGSNLIKNSFYLQTEKDNNLTKQENPNNYIKSENNKDKIFKTIKNTKENIQWKKMIKYGGVTAGVFGAVTLVYSLMMSSN